MRQQFLEEHDDYVKSFQSCRLWICLSQILYVFCVLRGRKIIEKLHLSRIFVKDLTLVWNGINAIVYTYVAFCLLPEFLLTANKGWYSLVCSLNDFYSTSGEALYIFAWSKVWCMGDSLMLILRKRPITYLHLIHHVVVVLQVVFTLFNTGAPARLGTMMNAVTSSVVYSYFVAQDLNPQLREMAIFIALLQVCQFGVGSWAIANIWWFLLTGNKCDTQPIALLFHFAIYLLFLTMFDPTGIFLYYSNMLKWWND